MAFWILSWATQDKASSLFLCSIKTESYRLTKSSWERLRSSCYLVIFSRLSLVLMRVSSSLRSISPCFSSTTPCLLCWDGCRTGESPLLPHHHSHFPVIIINGSNTGKCNLWWCRFILAIIMSHLIVAFIPTIIASNKKFITSGRRTCQWGGFIAWCLSFLFYSLG
jgi:hypothetical protein